MNLVGINRCNKKVYGGIAVKDGVILNELEVFE